MNKIIMSMVALFAVATPVLAQELPMVYTAEMWNADPEDKARKMVFSDEVIQVAPGATITWLATNKGHNVEFIDGPDGVELPTKSKLGVDATVTLTEPGVYVYVCSPHVAMGMIAIVVVGEVTPEQIAMVADAKLRGKAAIKLEELLGQIN